MEERVGNDTELLEVVTRQMVVLLEEMGGIPLGGMWDGKSYEFCWDTLKMPVRFQHVEKAAWTVKEVSGAWGA